jgi:hypothetical protein
MEVDVLEVLTAFIIRRQEAPLKSNSTSARLHSIMSQKAVIFICATSRN